MRLRLTGHRVLASSHEFAPRPKDQHDGRVSSRQHAGPTQDRCTTLTDRSRRPKILNRPYSITAEVDIPDAGAEGVLLSMGGIDGGISLYVQDGRLCFAHNYLCLKYFYAKSRDTVPPGHHFLSMEFEPTGEADRARGRGTPGTVALFADGEAVGEAEFSVTTPNRLGQGAAMQVGVDSGGAVTPEYQSPFPFAGAITRVIVDVSGEHVADYEAEMRVVLAKQ